MTVSEIHLLSFLLPVMMSSIIIFNFRVFGWILYDNLRHFSFRRLAFSIIFFVLMSLVILLTFLLRLLDEIFYIGYRKTKISNPVFIVSTPRSGTTLLHKLMSLDEERFAHFSLYHNFLPSILYYRFILVMKKLDRMLGMTMKRFWNRIERQAFKGWKEIHPMGFELREEDEGMFTTIMNSPACGMFSPWFRNWFEHTMGDRLLPAEQKKLMNYYFSTLQRFSYGWQKNKTVLVKNVMSSARLKMITEKMPDAKIILILRHPYQTIASITSMFSKPWGMLAPEIPRNSDQYRVWGEINIRFYQCILEASRNLSPKQLVIVRYEDLVHDPVATVHHIYENFGMETSPAFEKRLQMEAETTRKYSSHHSYSLEAYGYTDTEIVDKLSEVFSAFEFDPNPQKNTALRSSAS
jgi:hypothetical protein